MDVSHSASLCFGDIPAMTQALAWPSALVIIALLFRGQIRLVMERLVHLKYQDFELQFRHELELSEELAEMPVHTRLLDLPDHLRRVMHELNVPQVSVLGTPRGRVEEAWSYVRQAADRAVGTTGIDPAPALAERGILSGAGLLLFERLRRLHAQVVRTPRWEPTSAAADRFVRLAGTLVPPLALAGNRSEENHA